MSYDNFKKLSFYDESQRTVSTTHTVLKQEVEGQLTAEVLKPLPMPVGKYILDAVARGEIEQMMTPNGAYYHYSDVVKLLKRFI